MSKMIQIRNVPDDVHRRLKAHAAEKGLSLSELMLREATRLSQTLTIAEITQRIRTLPPVTITTEQIVEAIHAEREAGTVQIVEAVFRDRGDR